MLRGAEDVLDYGLNIIFSYDEAWEEARISRRYLADVMQRAARKDELLMENERLRRMMGFVRSRPSWTLEPAQVIAGFKGFVRIDRGSRQGVEPSMCVVTAHGIVGPVTQVDMATANVATLHNGDCRVAAMVARNRVRGMVHGSSNDLSRYCKMNYIDLHDDVRVGDLLVTSPESVFPAGYPIGRVRAVHEGSGSLWKYADVELLVDPYRLDEVFVLQRAVTPLEELAGSPAPSDIVSAAPRLPDTRSIQERYAP